MIDTIELPGARAIFSTRVGGVSEGPYSSLNLGILTDDDPARVARNRALLAEPGDKQLPQVDGHLTTVPGLGLLVLVADCYPVALSDGERVAMLHCGWRPLAGGIIARAVAEFDRPPAAAVGPGIGGCCYEVGPEVSERFAGVAGALDGRMLDLRRVIAAQLEDAGVRAVAHLDRCTSCEPDLYFSHRRDDGVTGRQGGLCVRSG